MRLIDADALVEKAYWHGEHPDVGNPFAEGVEAVDMSDIDNAPTIEAEPVRHGRWINEPCEHFGMIAHTHKDCGYTYASYAEDGDKYCPNCGAKMDLPN